VHEALFFETSCPENTHTPPLIQPSLATCREQRDWKDFLDDHDSQEKKRDAHESNGGANGSGAGGRRGGMGGVFYVVTSFERVGLGHGGRGGKFEEWWQKKEGEGR